MNLFRRAKQSILLAKAAIRIYVIGMAIFLCTTRPQAQTHTLSTVQLAIKGSLSLDSVTSLVHAKTGVRFSFNSVKISGSKIIFFPQASYSINHLLQHIHNTTGLYFFQYKQYYIFQDNPPKPRPAKIPVAVKAMPQTKTATRTALIKRTVQPQPATAKETVQPTPVVAREKPVDDTLVRPNDNSNTVTVQNLAVALASLPSTATGSVQTITPIMQDTVNTRIKAKPQPPAAPEPNNGLFHFQTGIFSTEVLYANAGIEVGIRPIHALFSFATNFDVSGPRLGLGSVIIHKETTQWQVKASVCFLQKDYLVDSFSTAIPITIKGQLYNAGIEWCRKMKTHLVFKAGLLFNLLQSRYYSNGNQRAVGTLPPISQNHDKEIYLLKPPYFISNSYSGTTASNIKTWVGVSVGFYYTLPRN